MSFLNLINEGQNMPKVDDSVRGQMLGFEQGMPQLLALMQQQYAPQAQAELAAQKSVAGGYNQNALDQLLAYAPQLADAGNMINRKQAMGDIATDVDTLKYLRDSGGLDIARNLDSAADPLYNQSRSNLFSGLDKYMAALSPNLTGSEMEQINRGIGATGGIGAPSQSKTISNALTFGQAGQNKLNSFGQGLSNASNILQQGKLPTGTFTTAFGKQRGNMGLSNFQATPQLSDTANQFGSQFLKDTAMYQDSQNQFKAGRKGYGDMIAQDVNNVAGIAGSFMGGAV